MLRKNESFENFWIKYRFLQVVFVKKHDLYQLVFLFHR